MKYTIITAVYNREDCIARCIESVIRNLDYYNDLEHIIIDDCSTDCTADIIDYYNSQYSHIKFAKFTENKGTNAARNAAIEKATGEYCIILDSDDYFVDNALQIIDNVVSRNTYNYYMFSPDDMIESYNQNSLLKSYQIELSFEDFLLNRVGGDFIHVMPTKIINQLPFDESLRIYEGVFFLRFYKSVKKMLFTKKIVTIRERSRQDSVTREIFKTNNDRIQRSISAITLKINWFKYDYLEMNHKDKLYELYISQIDNYLLVSNYLGVQNIFRILKNSGFSIPLKYKLMYRFQLGKLYSIITKTYFLLKYGVLKTKLR